MMAELSLEDLAIYFDSSCFTTAIHSWDTVIFSSFCRIG